MKILSLKARSLILALCTSNVLSYMTTPSPVSFSTVYSSHVVNDRAAIQDFNLEKKKSRFAIQEVRTIEEYRREVVEESDEKLVAVYFYAPWCVACRATLPGIASLAKKHSSNVKFIKVPVLEENAKLHQGLNVPSVPYLHLYHPTAGLIEEQKIVRKHLPRLNTMLQDYVEGSCSLERCGKWSPYYNNRAPKKLIKVPTTFDIQPGPLP